MFYEFVRRRKSKPLAIAVCFISNEKNVAEAAAGLGPLFCVCVRPPIPKRRLAVTQALNF